MLAALNEWLPLGLTLTSMPGCSQASADNRQASLMHTAVLSGSWPTLHLLLSWAADQDVEPSHALSLHGPHGLTPLHLLAVARSAERLLPAVLDSCPEAALLWFTSCARGGSSPAQLALAAGAPGLNTLASAALLVLLGGSAREPARLIASEITEEATPAADPAPAAAEGPAGEAASSSRVEAAAAASPRRRQPWLVGLALGLAALLVLLAEQATAASPTVPGWLLALDRAAGTAAAVLAVAAAAGSLRGISWVAGLWHLPSRRQAGEARASALRFIAATALAAALAAYSAALHSAAALGTGLEQPAALAAALQALKHVGWRLGWYAAVAAAAVQCARVSFTTSRLMAAPCLVLVVDVAAGVLDSWQQAVLPILLALALRFARPRGRAGMWVALLLAADMAQVLLLALLRGSLVMPAVMRKLSLLCCLAALLLACASARARRVKSD